jgi:hypothetical protein
MQKKIDEKLSDDDNTNHDGTEKENKNNNLIPHQLASHQ